MKEMTTLLYDDDEECSDYECLKNSNEDYNEDYNYYEYMDKESLDELYQYCLSPSLYDTGHYLLPLLGSAILFRLCLHSSEYISYKIFHILSAIIGLYVIQHYAQESLIILIIFVLFSYAVLYIPKKWHGVIRTCLSSFLIIAYCEFLMQPMIWHKIRSVIMIMAMKVISITIDTNDSDDLPDIYSYMGYMFCSVTCLFGPWVSFKDYLSLRYCNNQTKWWVVYSIGYAILSFVFLSISNCWTEWIFVDNSWKLVLTILILFMNDAI